MCLPLARMKELCALSARSSASSWSQRTRAEVLVQRVRNPIRHVRGSPRHLHLAFRGKPKESLLLLLTSNVTVFRATRRYPLAQLGLSGARRLAPTTSWCSRVTPYVLDRLQAEARTRPTWRGEPETREREGCPNRVFSGLWRPPAARTSCQPPSWCCSMNMSPWTPARQSRSLLRRRAIELPGRGQGTRGRDRWSRWLPTLILRACSFAWASVRAPLWWRRLRPCVAAKVLWPMRPMRPMRSRLCANCCPIVVVVLTRATTLAACERQTKVLGVRYGSKCERRFRWSSSADPKVYK